MEMHQIRYFLALSRSLNFTRAAEECGVSQPSLSRAIKQFEMHLGGELIQREQGLTHLTELGRRLLPSLQKCYDNAVEVQQTAKTFTRCGGGNLRIGLSPSVDVRRLAGHLKQITHDFPKVDVLLRRDPPADLLEQLKNGVLEIAITESLDGRWSRLDSWPMASEQFAVFINKANPLFQDAPIDVAALSNQRLLSLIGCPQTEKLIVHLGSDHGGRQEFESTEDVLALVAEDLGVAILPARMTPSGDVAAVALTGLNFIGPVYLHAISGRKRLAAASALIDRLRSDPVGRGTVSDHEHNPLMLAAAVCSL